MKSSTTIPLICIPFAGAGASFYHQWPAVNLSSAVIKPLQLPGRERQIAIEPFTDLKKAADVLVKEVLLIADGKSIALFGHCFLGSVLAYEIALRLEQEGSVQIEHLFVSAARTPDVSISYDAKAMSDKQFIAMVQKVTGYQHPAFSIPEMLELLLPALRADFEMDESYPKNNHLLSIPITAIAASDDLLVTIEQVKQWEYYTKGSFKFIQLNGGHMYLADSPEPLLKIIEGTLSSCQ